MISNRGMRRVAVWSFGLLALAARPLLACPVCFGDPESDMAQGAKAGILVLLAVVYAVVLTMVGVAGCWFIRARRLAAERNTSSVDR